MAKMTTQVHAAAPDAGAVSYSTGKMQQVEVVCFQTLAYVYHYSD